MAAVGGSPTLVASVTALTMALTTYADDAGTDTVPPPDLLTDAANAVARAS